MPIFRLFGVGKNGTVTYKQPDEDESTLANVWFDHPQPQFYLKSTFKDFCLGRQFDSTKTVWM